MKNPVLNISSLVGVIVLAFAIPYFVEAFTVLNFTVYIIMAILSLSLAFVWGMGGIMVLGHSAFFGLGAYAYAIAAVNFGPGWEAVTLSMLVPATFAALLGYFMFYGRISDIYVGVITLAVTLILFNLINSTSGPQYKIGSAPIGGYNGITAVPTLSWPNGNFIDINGMFYLSVGLLILSYLFIRYYLSTRYGKVTVAIRENERRAELLGYNVAQSKLITFSIGGAIAGLAGCMFANWGSFVGPTIFGLVQSAQIIIWVIVGGRGTLIGPILSCIAIQWMTTQLGMQQVVNVGFVLGIVLTIFVLLVPSGLAPLLAKIPNVVRSRLNGKPKEDVALGSPAEEGQT
ncbi:ABC transporter permease subunit [Hoeflea poritis]|uniref:Branched-chain amino acid ABC transporter permease n=1 Tax=Hoeflea poritis TaxID=2993659 RepID=A0ABT4VVH1_9HYPH|nr:branched-chain amino acid ABC transporter permease [Hoeflea poritis]MDA4848704.1 branched-chain amino acid ABC transporter permease [Hoeflea poritis]